MSVKKLENAGSWKISVIKRNEKNPERAIKMNIEIWDAEKDFAIIIGKDWYWINKKDFEKCWKEMV